MGTDDCDYSAWQKNRFKLKRERAHYKGNKVQFCQPERKAPRRSRPLKLKRA